MSFLCLGLRCVLQKKNRASSNVFYSREEGRKVPRQTWNESFETWISLVDVSYFSYLSSRIPLHFPSLFLNRFVDRKSACVVDFINWLSLLYFILLNISLFYSFVRKYIFSSESPVQKRKKEFFIIFTILFSVRHRYQIFIFPFN